MITYDFIEQQLSPLLFPQVHHLDGDATARARVCGSAHDTRASLTDFTKPTQGRARVAFAHHQAESSPELASVNIAIIYHMYSATIPP